MLLPLSLPISHALRHRNRHPRHAGATRSVYIVLGTLDELEKNDRAIFLERLSKMVLQLDTKASGTIVTSRVDALITTHMNAVGAYSLNLDTAKGSETDLAVYATGTVSVHGDENTFSNELCQIISSELTRRAHGMFLWASLAWAFFTDGVGIWTKKIIAQRLQVLQHLLPGMESLYQRTLDEVGLRYRNDLLHSLHPIVSAAKPLTVDDLSIALASRERRDELRDIDPRLNVQAFFRSACPHLIRIGKTGMGTLVHLSCKDYLIGAPMMNNKPNNSHIDAVTANLEMGLDCLSYLALDGFATHDLGIACEQHKFLSYAYEYWFHHLEGRNDLAEDIWHYLSRLFDLSTKRVRWYDISELVLRLWHHNLYCLFESGVKPPFQLSLNITDTYGDHFIHVVVTNMRKLPLEAMRFLTSLGLDINGRTRFRQALLHRCIREWQGEQDLAILREESGETQKGTTEPFASEKALSEILSFPGVGPDVVGL